jgi:hypothetical protein
MKKTRGRKSLDRVPLRKGDKRQRRIRGRKEEKEA